MARAIALLAVLLSLSTPSGRARADVTVYFGPPGPCGSVAAAPRAELAAPDDREADDRDADVIPDETSDDEDAPIAESAASADLTSDGSAESHDSARMGIASEPASEPALAVAAVAHGPVSAPVIVSNAPADPARAPEAAPELEPASLAPTRERSCAPVEIVRVGDGSGEHASLILVGCDGVPDAASLVELSLLARPHGEERPSDAVLAAHAADADWVAPRLRRLHSGLLSRLRAIADRFPGQPIEIVSGYRPSARDGSRHRFGRAIDLRVRGVEVATLDAFASTLEETGVGLYPTTDFIHVDVRTRTAHWIDTSGPGEPPALVREPRDERAPAPPGSARDAGGSPRDARPAGGDEDDDDGDDGEVDAAAIGSAAAELLEGLALELG